MTRRHGSRALRMILLLLLVGGITLVFRQGLMPGAFNPLLAVDLGQPNPWLVDWRLAALKYNTDLCRRVLISPHIDAQPIADNPPRGGCGWTNAVRMAQAGGCLLYTSPSPRDRTRSRMPSSA